VSWSAKPIRREGGQNNINDRGIYLADAFGNLELLHRDAAISSCYPMPFRPRPMPHGLPDLAEAGGEGRVLLLDVYRGLTGVTRGAVKRIRIIGVPAKTQPQMNSPVLGFTREDPGKVVLGTVPVEADGSAHFRMPAGVSVFFQALDAEGMAVQTMRTITYVQPGQTLACIGCHESRGDAPPVMNGLATQREPSRICPGPEGSWPLRYDRLVQPVLDKHCVGCHSPKGKPEAVAKLDLSPAKSYAALSSWGKPSLKDHVMRHYLLGHSEIGACAASNSAVLAHLARGHSKVELSAEDRRRLIVWMDTYGQRIGHFSDAQEKELVALREQLADMLEEK